MLSLVSYAFQKLVNWSILKLKCVKKKFESENVLYFHTFQINGTKEKRA